MVDIIKQKIEIEEVLKNKIEFICSFCNTTPTIIAWFNSSDLCLRLKWKL